MHKLTATASPDCFGIIYNLPLLLTPYTPIQHVMHASILCHNNKARHTHNVPSTLQPHTTLETLRTTTEHPSQLALPVARFSTYNRTSTLLQKLLHVTLPSLYACTYHCSNQPTLTAAITHISAATPLPALTRTPLASYTVTPLLLHPTLPVYCSNFLALL